MYLYCEKHEEAFTKACSECTRLAERERCAKVVDEKIVLTGSVDIRPGGNIPTIAVLLSVAEKIRKG